MIKNYFKIALRSFSRNLNYSLINVFGLAVGITCCIIIALYVRFEMSYESFQENRDEIYRYIPRSANKGELAMQTYTPAGMAPRFQEEFKEIKNYSRFVVVQEESNFKHNEKQLGTGQFCLADSAFFHMFSFSLIRGEANKVLNRPAVVVINRTIAEDFFPGEDPIGKLIEFDNKMLFEITGVFEDVPQNSHFQFSYLASFTSLPVMMEQLYQFKSDEILEDMGSSNYSTYLRIPAGVNDDLERRMSEKLHAYRTNGPIKLDNIEVDWLQPLNDIHFTSGIKGDSGGTGSIVYINVFSSVAILVLLIACFNFMNLGTALALIRAREVGLRKSIGASRRQLILQFIGESIFLIIIAFLIALQMVWLALPLFNRLMGLSLELNLIVDPFFALVLLSIALVTALVAGAYPAFYLSSFSPAKVLKGDRVVGSKAGLRKALTIVQFGIATFMIVATIVVFQQMSFMKNSSVGFDREQVINFQASIEVHRNYDLFKERLLKHSGVKAVTICSAVPGSTLGHWKYGFPGQEHGDVSINTVAADHDYLDVMGLKLVDGRKLSREFATDDSLAYLINETAARQFFLEEPVGTPFQVLDGTHPKGSIVGVVKDYHFRSLQHKVDPLVIRIDRDNAYVVAVKLQGDSYKETLAFIKKEWDQISPESAFKYSFLDDTYDRLYRSEEKTGVLMTSFSCLAIFVACLGLTGLASFLTHQRRKEISIRKVHGASTRQVVSLLSWDFIKLVLIGFVIMVPVAWYAVDKWLTNFAYQVHVSPVIFLISGLVVSILAFLTVGYHSYKASLSNPARVLREG
jgi:putative ABC transport system permease protein